jgi:RNA polymerase primary sigma factor
MSAPASGGRRISPVFRIALLAGVDAAVRLHLARGDGQDARDERGWTPLMLAASKGRLQVCRTLLEAAADPLAVAHDGTDALALATRSGVSEVVDLLRMAVDAKRPVDVEAPDAQQVVDVLPAESQVQSIASETADLASPTVSVLVEDSAPHTSTSPDDGEGFGDWEVDEIPQAPPIDVEAGSKQAEVQLLLDRQEAIDRSADWSDVFSDLPEFAEPVLQEEEQLVLQTLRGLLLRGLREGGVPEHLVEDLASQRSAAAGRDPRREFDHLCQVFGDLGADLDERFECITPYDSSAVELDPVETDEEVESVDAALAYLSAHQARSVDVLRYYLKEAQRIPLLTAEEEQVLGRTMEEARHEIVEMLHSSTEGQALLSQAVLADRSFTFDMPGQAADEDGDDYTSDLAGVTASTDPLDSEVDSDVEDREPAGLADSTLGGAPALQASSKPLVDDPAVEPSPETLSTPALLRAAERSSMARTPGRLSAAMGRLEKSRSRMIRSNLRLVVYMATKYLYSGLPLEDLVQAGNLGLIRAVDKYDWRRGFRFSTMATWWVRQQVSRSVADTSTSIRLPVHAFEVAQKLAYEMKRSSDHEGQGAQLRRLAQSMHLTLSKLQMILRPLAEPEDVEAVLDEMASRESIPDPSEAVEHRELQEQIDQLLSELDSKSAKVIRLRFGLGQDEDLTLEECGQMFGVTRERIRQIEAKALRRLTAPARRDRLADWSMNAAPKVRRISRVEVAAELPNDEIGSAGEEPLTETVDEVARAPMTMPASGRNDVQRLVIRKVLQDVERIGWQVEQGDPDAGSPIWVIAGPASDNQARRVVRRLLELGFAHWPGRGYWL